MKKEPFIFFLCWLTGIGSLAQQPVFQSLEWEEGSPLLPQILHEDQQGFIWLGNEEKLYRFDGYTFEEAIAEDSLSSPITALCNKHDGGLWIGTKQGLLMREHQGQLHTVSKQISGSPITSILQFAPGFLWVATYGNGLFQLSTNGDIIEHFTNQNGLSDLFIYDMALGPDNTLWVGTDAGANSITGKKNQWKIRHFTKNDGLPDNIIKAIASEADGTMIFGGYEGGISRLVPGDDKFRRIEASVNLPAVTHLIGSNRSIWIGTDNEGLYEWDERSNQLQALPQAATGDVRSLLLDKEENLWICSRKLGFRRGFSPIRLIAISHKGNKSEIRAVALDQQGQIWYSTEEAVYRISSDPSSSSPDQVFVPSTHGLPPVISMYLAEDGTMWLGTFGSGVVHLAPDFGTWTMITERDGLTNGNILSITGQGEDIWVGTLGGISNIHQTTSGYAIKNFTRNDGVGDNYIYQVKMGGDGKLWIATDGQGLTSLENGQFTNYQAEEGLTDRVIYSLTIDRNGNTWALSQEGRLFRVEGNNVREIPEAFRQHRVQASGLISADDGALLIVHEEGIDRFDPETRLLIIYGQSVGVDDPSPDLNAVCRDKEGNIWIGTRQGLICYRPLASDARRFPQLVLDKISLFFIPQDSLPNHALSAEENHLTFDYLALWYQDADAVRYRHKLNGYDLNWVPTRDRRISYPRLNRGDFEFSIAAGLGTQFPSQVSKQFSINPPFYATWWFALLCMASIFAITAAAIRYREHRLVQNSKMEKENIQYQFDLLRSQVNPHFLFNSFNTLTSLIESDGKAAVGYLERLSDMFRNMLAYRKETVITLREELMLLHNYVFLQQQRYLDKLQVDIQIDDNLLNANIPPLTLQMLVENAIKHNIISTSKPLKITVVALGQAEITISNPYQPKRQPQPSTGLGLENIKKRFQLLTSREVKTVQTDLSFSVTVPLLT
ncbi:MAG: histidine kinase [Bacteroidia bacterium]|nr:histidine kinase [Bacteroidia bacterium]